MKKTVEIPAQTRAATVGQAEGDSRMVPMTWTTGAAVKRVDFWTDEPWIEELCCDADCVRMGRMNSGAPLLNSHCRFDLSGVLGVVESAQVDGERGTCTVRFSRRADVEPIFQDVKDGIIRNVSVGYQVYRYADVSTEEDQKACVRRMRAMDWEPTEVSLVPVGADASAGVGRAETPKHACEIEFAERSAETPEPNTAQAPPACSGEVQRDLLRRKLDLTLQGV